MNDILNLLPTIIWVLFGSFLLVLFGLKVMRVSARYNRVTGFTTALAGILLPSYWYWRHTNDFNWLVAFAYVNPTTFLIFVGAGIAALVIVLIW
jgi:hypothetical protein